LRSTSSGSRTNDSALAAAMTSVLSLDPFCICSIMRCWSLITAFCFSFNIFIEVQFVGNDNAVLNHASSHTSRHITNQQHVTINRKVLHCICTNRQGVNKEFTQSVVVGGVLYLNTQAEFNQAELESSIIKIWNPIVLDHFPPNPTQVNTLCVFETQILARFFGQILFRSGFAAPSFIL